MKKLLVGGIVIFLLVGCTGKKVNEDTKSTDDIFKKEIVAVSEIGDAKGKILFEKLTIEELDRIFNDIFELAIFETSSVEYGEITQGAGSDGNGGRVFCCKLPAKVTFSGTKDSVERFVEYFEDIENVVSFGDFKVEILEDGKYKVTTLINFLGRDIGGTLSNSKKAYTIKRNEVEVKEEDITLRNFDVSMIIRPSNSDSAAVALGIAGDDSYRICNDENMKHEVEVTFSNEANKYYCEYSIDGKDTTKVNIKPSGNILFDILSCEIIEEDDSISVDLFITNNSNKKVSIVTYDDKDRRVNIVEKAGNIEVKK